MPYQDLSRLNATDASFLVQERTGSHMHIGGVMIFEGPAPELNIFKRHIESRLHMVPRYRQRLVWPRFQAGRPFWADDPDFNLSYHLRDTALPEPGNDEQLERLIARIFSQRLDRRKPLWEMWLVDGLSGGRFAMILKSHHSMIDGIAGIDVGTVLMSMEPTTTVEEPRPWHPRPLPTQGELIEIGLREAAEAPFKAVNGLVDLARGRESARSSAAGFMSGVTKAISETLDAAPRSPLNTQIGQHRRFKFVRNSLDEFREIKSLLDTTVNDVVLTITSDALGRWLRSRYYPTDGLRLRALVPVSTRPQARRGEDIAAGNELLAMRGSLPVEEMDALKRLSIVKQSMEGLKKSNQAIAADALTAVQNFAPPNILAQASRINFSTRLFNLLVTNVPGPQIPLYLLDRQMLDAFPVPFLAENHGLAVAIMSYNGRINFGILGDYDAIPDIQVIADSLADSRDDLLDAAAQVKTKVREVMRTGEVAALAPTAEAAAKATKKVAARKSASMPGTAVKSTAKQSSKRSPAKPKAATGNGAQPASAKPAAKTAATSKSAAKSTKKPATKAKPTAKPAAKAKLPVNGADPKPQSSPTPTSAS
ncbi:MAG: wax ester/triacylglycerol synthase family O-acyltransferase [Actinobacteria bacterium]|nr:wax ester/triacylglycerol synthase family O-acyltransferase [Actinomycetota bacterium]